MTPNRVPSFRTVSSQRAYHPISVIFCFLWFSLVTRTALWGELPVGDPNRPLTYQDAVDLAVSSSVELRSAAVNAALRGRRWQWGLRAFFPRLTVSGGEEDRLSMTGEDSFIKTYTLSLEQLVWDGGRLSLNRAVEAAEMELENAELRRKTQELGESALGAYRKVLMGRMVTGIKRSSLEALKEQLKILETEFQRGLALETDLREAELERIEAQIDVDKQVVDTEEAEAQLADLLGLPTLPFLGETIDLEKKTVYPDPEIAGSVGRAVNPQLTVARHSILKRKAELRSLSMAWVPNIKVTGDFSVSGKQYPLTHYAWNIGAVIQVSTPYLSGSVQGAGGMDGPYDKTARLRSSGEALPDPASGLDVPAAQLALRNEEQNYELLVGQVDRKIKSALRLCRLLEQKRDLTAQAVRVGQQKKRLLELRINLGQITRLELMKGQIEAAKQEEALVSAAVDLLAAERELEILLDLSPGALGDFNRRYGRMG